MIPSWFKAMLGLGERAQPPEEDSIASKCRGLQNLKRLNDLVLSGECDKSQLAELELGAETISLNLRKSDTDLAKKKEGAA